MLEPVEKLAQQVGAKWPTILAARVNARAKLSELSAALADTASSDSAVVAYGSLARLEWTIGSDIDWTLLVDGPAKPDQMTAVRQIRAEIARRDEREPSSGGAFGSMSFSHELVHRIGGEADTNRITTQRVLLLLESVAVVDPHLVHRRVIRSVLDSYLEQGGFHSNNGPPRFLLNDVVRYWRTIAVDFAAKAREQGDKKRAIRRLKLRTSRKLIFAAGLVMALENCVTTSPATERVQLLGTLVDAARKTPLDLIAEVALASSEMEPYVKGVFDAYERFLTLLDNEAKRKRLETIPLDDEATDSVVAEARNIGKDFGSAIETFFFDSDRYRRAIRTYGVF